MDNDNRQEMLNALSDGWRSFAYELIGYCSVEQVNEIMKQINLRDINVAVENIVVRVVKNG